MASAWGHEGVVDALIRHGSDYDLKNYEQETAVSLAVINGHLKTIKLLSEVRVDLKARDTNGRTLLYHAVQNVQGTDIRIFCSFSVDLEAQDEEGQTPLHLVASIGQDSIFRKIACMRAKVNALYNYYTSSLYQEPGNDEFTTAFETFADIGVNLEAHDDSKNTPLHLAASRGHVNRYTDFAVFKVAWQVFTKEI
ncbi:hypothetical protein N7491_000029 [Penicillium cf. griseofulvum]|nr:hypothetical protein N7491_000029 [Penicillium cf. griseofulvum]